MCGAECAECKVLAYPFIKYRWPIMGRRSGEGRHLRVECDVDQRLLARVKYVRRLEATSIATTLVHESLSTVDFIALNIDPGRDREQQNVMSGYLL